MGSSVDFASCEPRVAHTEIQVAYKLIDARVHRLVGWRPGLDSIKLWQSRRVLERYQESMVYIYILSGLKLPMQGQLHRAWTALSCKQELVCYQGPEVDIMVMGRDFSRT